MLAETLEKGGIPRGDYLIRVNNRKVLNGVREAVAEAVVQRPDEPPDFYDNMSEWQASILRTIDKFDKVGEVGLRELLGDGRLDASGAYIDGIRLEPAQVEPVIAFLTSKGANNTATLANLSAAVGSSEVGMEGVREQIGRAHV